MTRKSGRLGRTCLPKGKAAGVFIPQLPSGDPGLPQGRVNVNSLEFLAWVLDWETRPQRLEKVSRKRAARGGTGRGSELRKSGEDAVATASA